jgi:predicted XRE-type DNA-binding protein
MQKMSSEKQPEIEVSTGNIFADLGLDDADELYTRACLGVQVMKILKERSYSHKGTAELLGLKQSEVAALMRAEFSRFSQERLIGFLNKLNQKVIIHVSHHHEGEPYQQVRFVSEGVPC